MGVTTVIIVDVGVTMVLSVFVDVTFIVGREVVIGVGQFCFSSSPSLQSRSPSQRNLAKKYKNIKINKNRHDLFSATPLFLLTLGNAFIKLLEIKLTHTHTHTHTQINT